MGALAPAGQGLAKRESSVVVDVLVTVPVETEQEVPGPYQSLFYGDPVPEEDSQFKSSEGPHPSLRGMGRLNNFTILPLPFQTRTP